MRKFRYRAAVFVLAIGMLGVGSGCAATSGITASQTPAAGSHVPSGVPSAATTMTPAPTADPVGFFVPSSCLDVVPAERLDYFAGLGWTLDYGPGSASGTLLDRYPVEDESADIQCLWGTPTLDAGIEIAIGPNAPETQAAVVAHLASQHMGTSTDGEVIRYFRNGNELAANDLLLDAQVNIIRPGSWITVAMHPGGVAAYEIVVVIADEVETRVNAT